MNILGTRVIRLELNFKRLPIRGILTGWPWGSNPVNIPLMPDGKPFKVSSIRMTRVPKLFNSQKKFAFSKNPQPLTQIKQESI